MATIAKGMITLSSVNDAYSVSLSPSSCVVNAKWNGEDPDYTNAYSDITVYRGEETVAFKMLVIQSSNIGNWTIENNLSNTKRIRIEQLAANKLTASLKIQISVGTEFTTTVNLPVTVVRETSMLDWILDWEGREKTEISGEYIITPKIFVGKSENGGQLTGTYIGPAFDGSGRTGVFGYNSGKEIFHLDNTGGMIGGWEIQNGGIQTSDGTLKILSEGTIISAPGGTTAWELKKDGSASFAKGKVNFYANGNANFEGTISSKAGEIGGWKIGQHSLRNQSILIDSQSNYIGIYNSSTLTNNTERTADDFHKTVQIYGGVAMFYTSDSSYGIEGWLPCGSVAQISDTKRIFSLGSVNKIAGWHFNEDSLWYGEDSTVNNVTTYARVNTEGAFTSIKNAITIGSKGIRGNFWRLDCDGSGALANGKIWWDATGYCEFKGTLNGNTIIGANISGGTITAVDYIKSESGSWQLNKDGSGQLANGNISWKDGGDVNVRGGLYADTFELAICTTMSNGYIDGSTGTFISPDSGSVATLILPALHINRARIFHLMVPSNNEQFKIGFADEDVVFTIPGQENIDPSYGGNSNLVGEDGFLTMQGWGGEWFELIGIKTSSTRVLTLIEKWERVTTLTHYWDGTILRPVSPVIMPTSAIYDNSNKPALSNTYKTLWFAIPKSSKMHWFMMAMMELTL